MKQSTASNCLVLIHNHHRVWQIHAHSYRGQDTATMQTSLTNPWNQLTLLPCCSKTSSQAVVLLESTLCPLSTFQTVQSSSVLLLVSAALVVVVVEEVQALTYWEDPSPLGWATSVGAAAVPSPGLLLWQEWMPVLVQDLKTLVASQMWQCCHSAHCLQDRIGLAIQLEYLVEQQRKRLVKSSAKVLCLPMGHHFLVGDLPCGTQVLFLHGQPPHFLRPFLQEHWPHFLDSQCCLAPYLDSLAQVQTSSQVKISQDLF